jgi:DNA topoisomerase-1
MKNALRVDARSPMPSSPCAGKVLPLLARPQPAHMRLVVVESPNKTAKIRQFLGSEYRVAASFGHVRDLPSAGGLAVRFVDGRVEPQYEPLEKANRAIADLRRLADAADAILLATDPDREGEAIAWHVAALLGANNQKKCSRIIFHAITAKAVLAAVAAPRPIDQHLVDAQQARRILDRVVGWLVSPTLRPVGRDARSAGRVQSVAVRLVADREREIQAFDAKDFFVIDATVDRPGVPPPFKARLVRWKGEPLEHRLTDQAIAGRTVEWCRRQPWIVHACDRRDQVRNPPPPFTTATVQQAASVRLHLPPEETMRQLQALFEAGHITYHRTDSVALSDEAITAARQVISTHYNKRYLPEKPVIHATKSVNAQEAHEAIRPTHPESGQDLPHAAADLYKLIWQRFIACQMTPGRDQVTTIDVACAPGTWNSGPMGVFQAKGVVVEFDGWRTLGADATDEAAQGKKRKRGRPKKTTAGDDAGNANTDDDDGAGVVLPMLEPGQDLRLVDLGAVKRTTRPPARFTQASLIKRLEREGIGRPSTYANILRTILDRGYVGEAKRMLHGTDLGLALTDYLTRKYAGNFIELDFTRRMEDALDQVARGEQPWEPLVTRSAQHLLKLAQAAGLRGDPLTGS